MFMFIRPLIINEECLKRGVSKKISIKKEVLRKRISKEVYFLTIQTQSTIFLRISFIGSPNYAPKTAPINIPTTPLITAVIAVQQEQHGQHGQHIFF